MWEKILPWIGGIFAGLGLIFLFFDIINSIRKRNRRKLNIAGLVILSIAIVGYFVTDVILRNSTWPPLASFIWILFFWIYVILQAVGTFGDIKAHRRRKRAAATKAQDSDDTTASSAEAEEEAPPKSKKKKRKVKDEDNLN